MRSRTNVIYHKMKHRCTNPANNRWEFYGGRGITVCKEWMESFEKFKQDMGECPDGYQIDRIDHNGNYEPGNCRWVLPRDNVRNRSISLLSEEKVKLIRAIFRAKKDNCSVLKMANAIAPLFGVKPDTIRKVQSGRLWPEIV